MREGRWSGEVNYHDKGRIEGEILDSHYGKLDLIGGLSCFPVD